MDKKYKEIKIGPMEPVERFTIKRDVKGEYIHTDDHQQAKEEYISSLRGDQL